MMTDLAALEPPPYPNPPVTRVALDVRFPDANPAVRMTPTLQRELRNRLDADSWVVTSQLQAEITLNLTAGGGPVAAPFHMVTLPMFVRRTQFSALAVGDGGLTLETTDFRNYGAFRELAEQVITAVADVLAPEGVLRLGLRYIDELRRFTTDRERPAAWAEVIDPSLVGPQIAAMADQGYVARHWQGEVFFDVGERRGLVLHYEPRPGPLMYPNGPLLRPRPPDEGPWFLLDFDAFWIPEEIPPFDVALLMDECDGLKRPMYALFELLTTEPLRAVFNRQEGGDDVDHIGAISGA